MKPRRLVRATTFSINCSRGTGIASPGCPHPDPLPLARERGTSLSLQDGQDVARRVLEPGDIRTSIVGKAARDPFVVRDALVVLELDAFSDELVDRFIDVV